jgi:NTE family protein
VSEPPPSYAVPALTPPGPPHPGRIALVLSGGGARGAYEVGVLTYVLERLTARREPIRLDVVCGTSVGAINACFLAAHLADPVSGIRRLADLWTGIDLDVVLRFGMRQVATLHRVLLGGGAESVGLFDVQPMSELVQREIPWRAISRNMRHGLLRGLSISTTEVASGRTVLFMQTGGEGRIHIVPPPRTVIRYARVGPQHALASAAIPLMFPAVTIEGGLYVDGGVRQNTPIAPAIRMGATHVFAVGLSVDPASSASRPYVVPGPPSATFLLGKVLNAFLLDHIQNDFELLERVNAMIDDGTRAFGPEFLQNLNAAAVERGRPSPYTRVESLVVRPSENIGAIAAHCVRTTRLRGSMAVRRLMTSLDVGGGTEADLASYLLFDGSFARRLIDLGRVDAASRRDDIDAFFESARRGT